MRSMMKSTGLATAAFALALTGAACGDDGGEDVAGFCKEYRSFEDESEQLFEGALAASDDAGLEEAKQAFDDASSGLADLADEAPDDIKDDVETIASAFDEANDQIQGAESVEDLQSMEGGAIESEETDAAGTRVEDWAEDNCDSGGGGTDG